MEIVLAVTNSQSSSFAALDNINVRFGTENFQNIRKLIGDVAECFEGSVSNEVSSKLTQLCNDVEAFLKHNFPAHLQAESECKAHCIRFGLSDILAKSAMKVCRHIALKNIFKNI